MLAHHSRIDSEESAWVFLKLGYPKEVFNLKHSRTPNGLNWKPHTRVMRRRLDVLNERVLCQNHNLAATRAVVATNLPRNFGQ